MSGRPSRLSLERESAFDIDADDFLDFLGDDHSESEGSNRSSRSSRLSSPDGRRVPAVAAARPGEGGGDFRGGDSTMGGVAARRGLTMEPGAALSMEGSMDAHPNSHFWFLTDTRELSIYEGFVTPNPTQFGM